KARYDPHFSHSRIIESVWWGVPLVIITALAVVTWRSSHQLDPFKSLAANQKQITIQVVALNWKWLFIYPEQNIASVNLVEFPQNTPVEFNITADAPMNSFWIPQLGGQIYAMSGMTTRLNLMADRIGTYHGASANISGKGFAGMEFLAKSVSAADYNSWIKQISKTNNSLSLNNYNKLAVPSMNNPVSYYSSVENGLYEGIVNKFTNPGLPVSQPLIQSGED
ncbi:MAG TPA: COX aromatic rich motif-containing protein, partial [Candidatus Saccharimonadales bacterium]|nr:COX aromatic rich motif-containing protein [Candidatus Saccharimonadales bacterium]